MHTVEQLKKAAADTAVSHIKSGMVVGLSTGSAAIWGVRRLAELLASGEIQDIVAIPTAVRTEEAARALGIPLTTLAEHPQIDITFDGADEVDPQLNLIKGGGGALLREKIVAQASLRNIIIVDDSKISPQLGTLFALPVEVIPFAWETQVTFLQNLGAAVSVRRTPDGEKYITDQGNYILDCAFTPIVDCYQLNSQLNGRAGIVEHGLFLDLATDVIAAAPGAIRHLKREK